MSFLYVIHISSSPAVVPEPASSASPGKLLEVHILGPPPDGAQQLVFTRHTDDTR